LATHGNPAGFRTFPLALCRSPSFVGGLPMNVWRPSAPSGVSVGVRRQRVHKVDTRWDTLEYASLLAASEATGLTRGGYIRALVIGTAGPRAQRAPSFDAHALAHATAALNRVGNNVNQIAKIMNFGGVGPTTAECFAVLADVRSAVRCILDIFGHRAAP
jgi:hypothetical protein